MALTWEDVKFVCLSGKQLIQTLSLQDVFIFHPLLKYIFTFKMFILKQMFGVQFSEKIYT